MAGSTQIGARNPSNAITERSRYVLRGFGILRGFGFLLRVYHVGDMLYDFGACVGIAFLRNRNRTV